MTSIVWNNHELWKHQIKYNVRKIVHPKEIMSKYCKCGKDSCVIIVPIKGIMHLIFQWQAWAIPIQIKEASNTWCKQQVSNKHEDGFKDTLAHLTLRFKT